MTCSHCPFPDQDDERIFLAPGTLGKSFQGRKGFFSRRSPIDRFEFGHNRFTVFPSGVFQGITDQVNHAGLNLGQGNTAVIASGNPFSPSTTAIRMSQTPRFLISVITLSQNFAPSLCSIQIPRMSLVPSGSTPSAR